MTSSLSTWVGIENEAHLSVTVAGDAAEAASSLMEGLIADAVASRISQRDATVWGAEAEAEARVRLGWVNLPQTSRELLGRLDDLYSDIRSEGINRVVLAGMGGSSLGPEVICGTYGVPLVTLDSTDPDQVRAALTGDLEHTILVVSSKSGGTVETDSQRRVFEEAFEASGIDPRRHIVVVTDPGSPLHKAAEIAGYRDVFLADPHVGGRFSALSAFGLVPTALAGVPVAEILDEADAVSESLAEDHAANPAIVLGAAMAGSHRRSMVFSDHDSGLVGFAEWAEQLIAESTGKNGVGVLPVVAEQDAPDAILSDTLDTRLVALDADEEPEGHAIWVAGTLGGQFLLWEYATAIAGRILGINPFDQPNVESAKIAARALLDALPEPGIPEFTDGTIEVRSSEGLLAGATTLEDAVGALKASVPRDGYLAVMAYLNREDFATLPEVRASLATSIGRPVTFGWGPRFLHSTGQLHKGGAPLGAFLQITGTFADDMDVPGRPFSFGQLIGAQADGDATVLFAHDRPVLRLNASTPDDVSRIAAALTR